MVNERDCSNYKDIPFKQAHELRRDKVIIELQEQA